MKRFGVEIDTLPMDDDTQQDDFGFGDIGPTVPSATLTSLLSSGSGVVINVEKDPAVSLPVALQHDRHTCSATAKPFWAKQPRGPTTSAATKQEGRGRDNMKIETEHDGSGLDNMHIATKHEERGLDNTNIPTKQEGRGHDNMNTETKQEGRGHDNKNIKTKQEGRGLDDMKIEGKRTKRELQSDTDAIKKEETDDDAIKEEEKPDGSNCGGGPEA
jgi:hypothetical protein